MATTPLEQAAENKSAFDFSTCRYYLAREVILPRTTGLQLVGNFDFSVYESRECWRAPSLPMRWAFTRTRPCWLG